MDGLIFVVLGAALIVLAIVLILLRSRLKKIRDEIKNGLKRIEDLITTSITGDQGVIDQIIRFLKMISELLNGVAGQIDQERNRIINQIFQIFNNIRNLLAQYVLTPSSALHQWLHGIGKKFGDIAVASVATGMGVLAPFGEFKEPCDNLANFAESAGEGAYSLGDDILDDAQTSANSAVNELGTASNQVRSMSSAIQNDLGRILIDIKSFFQTTVSNMDQTRLKLDSLLDMVSIWLIIGVFIAGIIFIVIGFVIGF